MKLLKMNRWVAALVLVGLLNGTVIVHAEEDYVDEEETTEDAVSDQEEAPRTLKPIRKNSQKLIKKKNAPRKFFSDDSPRTDAGIFHVAFALGGSVYIE
ncbi:MAG: hypothetical protein ACKN9V_09100, partial [Pseudomonadota bacterium]